MDEQVVASFKQKYADRSTAELRHRISLGLDGELSLILMEWVFEREAADENARVTEQKRLADESLDAAKLAAETSRDAAVASRRSAFWTMIAAIVGAIAAIAAAGSTVLSVLQAMDRLPK